MTQDDSAVELAREHNKKVRDFFYHLMVYVLVNALLVVIDLRGGETSQTVFGLDWAYWVILFWGFGIIGHGIYVYFDDYRARKLAERDR